MSQRFFKTAKFEVMAGWDRPLQYHFLNITKLDVPEDEDDVVYASLYEGPCGIPLEAIAPKLEEFGITSLPPAFLGDLEADELENRGNLVFRYEGIW